MTVWTYALLMQLRYRIADLRAALGEPSNDADPAVLAELARQYAAAHHLGEDPGHDPTYDPYRAPERNPYPDYGPEV